jgi:peptide/nickel transport system substrate-binding protein
MRRAMTLTLDRKAFIDILSEGHGDIGGVMQPLPEGFWGMPPDVLKTLPGYDPDTKTEPRRARSCASLATAPISGWRSKCRRAISRRFRDPAVILIDQLKEMYIDAEVEIVETALWYPKMYRKDYTHGG